MKNLTFAKYFFAIFASLRETDFFSRKDAKHAKGRKVLSISLGLLSVFATISFAQSSDQNFPTHVTSNEINGVIKPRSIGDARLTTYFYLFEGTQGDIFINVATTNFSGDIDVYDVGSLKPLTKIVMYADVGRIETGRLIYLRQPTRLLLRIDGRTPNDDAATFRIKFAGSFVALAPETYEPPPAIKSRESVESREPKKSEKTDETESTTGENASVNERARAKEPDPKTTDPNADTVFENKSAKVTVKPVKTPPVKKNTRETTSTTPKAKVQKPKTEDQLPKPPSESDPLANVNLVIVFKDGSITTRPMTEIARFSFDRGTLTVVEKTGKIARYQMTDVAKVTVE